MEYSNNLSGLDTSKLVSLLLHTKQGSDYGQHRNMYRTIHENLSLQVKKIKKLTLSMLHDQCTLERLQCS